MPGRRLHSVVGESAFEVEFLKRLNGQFRRQQVIQILCRNKTEKQEHEITFTFSIFR